MTRGSDSDGTPAIRVIDLEKSYGSGETAVTAVDGISFAVQPGSVVGLLGPNGAGKTTTIKSMLGLVLPDNGTVEIAGIDVEERPAEAYGLVGAMLEGARNVYWRLTVRENLAFFAGLGGDDPGGLEERHERLLQQFGLADRADAVVNDLSRGMKQKVSLASTLARDVEVAFMDEPTLGLDVETSRELRSELSRLAEREETTILLSSHDMDVIESVCDRVIVLDDGTIVADDEVDALLEVFHTREYEIRTDTEIEDGVVERLARSVGAEWTAAGNRTRIRFTASGSNDLYEALAILREAGTEPRDVESLAPDLEEVFLRLTRESSASASGPARETGSAADERRELEEATDGER